MFEISCDVLVIGGGPAGLSSAIATSNKGLETVVLEEHAKAGIPIQCGECIGEDYVKLFPFKIPKKIFTSKTEGMKFFLDNYSVTVKGGYWKGVGVDRSKLEQWLAKKATAFGSKILYNTKFDDIVLKKDKAIVTAYNGKIKIRISADFVIAADGVHSLVAKRLGIYNKNAILGKVISYSFPSKNLLEPKLDQIFLGDFGKSSYGYIFPRNHKEINVGVAMVDKAGDIEKAWDSFLKLSQVKKQVNPKSKILEKSGYVPVTSPTSHLYYKNVVFVGDSANQNVKPFVEGLFPAMICGTICGEHVFLEKNKEKGFIDYEKKIKERLPELYFTNTKKFLDVFYNPANENKKKKFILLGLTSGLVDITEYSSFNKLTLNGVKKELMKRGLNNEI